MVGNFFGAACRKMLRVSHFKYNRDLQKVLVKRPTVLLKKKKRALNIGLFHRAHPCSHYTVHWKNAEFNEEVEVRQEIPSGRELQGVAMGLKKDTNWILVPGTERDLEQVRQRCRRLVRRRAMVSAGVAAVPIPGLDVVSDLRMFALLIDDINQEFGLSAEQIGRMQPKFKLIAYEAAIGVGGMLVGKLVTREVIIKLLKHTGLKSVTRQASKFVPFAGQMVSAAIGFAAFRQIGYQHVDACTAVAQELLTAGVHPTL
jgi:uncharacterized protein (DUF697 family)